MEGRLVKGQIGVIGGAHCAPERYEIARDAGREVARRGFALVCGGLGGVMPKVALWPVAKPVVGVKSWELEGRVPQAQRGDEAVAMLLEMLG